MQEGIAEKRVNERLIEKLSKTTTTLFSNNPFDSTRRLNIKDNNIVLDESEVDVKLNNSEARLVLDIDKRRIEYSLEDFNKDKLNPFLANNVGLAYLSTKDFINAKIYFELSLAFNPDFRAAKLNLANLYRQTNDVPKALEIYEGLLKTNSHDKGVLINLGNIYLVSAQVLIAEKYFNLVWEDNKNDADVGNKLGFIQLIKGNINKAISILRHCISISPNNAAIYNTLGIAYIFGRLEKKAIQAFKTSLNLSPSYKPALLNLAEALIKNNQAQNALEIVEQFCDKYDDYTTQDLLAKLYLYFENYNRSLIILKKLYKNSVETNHPMEEVSRLLNNIGVVFHRTGNLTNAEIFYLESLSTDKKNKVVINNLIDVCFSKNKLEEANNYIELLRVQFPEDTNYLYYKAIYFKEKGEISSSIEQLKNLIGSIKNFTPAYGLLSYIYSEIVFDYQEAISILEEALIYLPNDMVIINNLAYNYLMADEIIKAKEVLERAKNIDNNIFLTATRGLLAIKENNLELGRYLYNTASNLAKDYTLKNNIDQKKNIEVARYFFRLGSYSIAVDLLGKVLNSKPTLYTNQAKHLLAKYSQLGQ